MVSEILVQREGILFQIRDLKKGSIMNATKQSGELVINGEAIRFVLRRQNYGAMLSFSSVVKVNVTVTDFDTPVIFDEAGYICVLLTISPIKLQLSVYIKKENWDKLMLAILKI